MFKVMASLQKRLGGQNDSGESESGDWHDRVESYKNVLKEQQLEKQEIKKAEAAPRPRRRPAPASGGFGKRGKV